MNPVLLKPLADTRSDVVVMGRSRPDLATLPWHRFHGDARLLAPAPADLARRTGVPVLAGACAIVLPGTRNTIHDLDWLWRTGVAAAVRAQANAGTPVLGICGGYQMLGTAVEDPHGIEAGGTCPGLDLLDVHTVLVPVKETRWTDARVHCAVPGLPLALSATVRGYEIHHGATRAGPSAVPWLAADHALLGAASLNGRSVVLGAYLHALFADDLFRAAFIALSGGSTKGDRWASRLDAEIERIADAVQSSIDMSRIDHIIETGVPCA